jgi:hypothetical protein
VKCAFHNDRDTDYVCPSCGRPVCGECTTIVNGRAVCKACAYSMHQAPVQPYKSSDDINGFLFFIFLAVPGLRHMYMGLMKRGLQFLTAFFGFIVVAAFLDGGLGDLLIPVILIVWFYSAFDSYQCRKLMVKGEKIEDIPAIEGFSFDNFMDFFGKRKKITGTAVLFIGIYMFFRELRTYEGSLGISYRVFEYINFGFDLIIPLILVAGGIYLIKRGSTRQRPENE